MKNKRHSSNFKNKILRLERIPEQLHNMQQTMIITERHNINKIMFDKMGKYLKKGKKAVRSLSVLVRSQQESKLMNHIRDHNLPKLAPIIQKKRNNSALESILTNQDKFIKTYFKDLRQAKKDFHYQKIQFEFPEIRVGQWRVSGFLNGQFLLLKGIKKGKQTLKKYLYQNVYNKLKNDYESWVETKFIYQI